VRGSFQAGPRGEKVVSLAGGGRGSASALLAIRARAAYSRAGRGARRNNNMARKPGTRAGGEFVLFNVIYEDGTQRSNRRVPAELLGGLDGDEPARVVIEQQDREIAAKSGMPPLAIKKIARVGAEEKERARNERRANEKRAGAR
jgi:hypothetical protein